MQIPQRVRLPPINYTSTIIAVDLRYHGEICMQDFEMQATREINNA